jgi:tRNA threonylcarbamoyl adenosine modification protein (Sua5/YciO/YrdC/YwlC family)
MLSLKTHFLNAANPGAIEHAATLLRQGELVVFPTDTVYGVGVDATQYGAVEKLYAAKERMRSKGIPILIADADAIEQVAVLGYDKRAWIEFLITGFWPGPLTLVLPQQPGLPTNLSPNKGIAVRLPNNDIARNLIRAAGGALAVSSANLSGEPPATSAESAFAIFDGIVAAVLDGGPSRGKTPSTVLDCTEMPPRILRRGPIPAQMLRPEQEQLA